jgi:hypothetical protein
MEETLGWGRVAVMRASSGGAFIGGDGGTFGRIGIGTMGEGVLIWEFGFCDVGDWGI